MGRDTAYWLAGRGRLWAKAGCRFWRSVQSRRATLRPDVDVVLAAVQVETAGCAAAQVAARPAMVSKYFIGGLPSHARRGAHSLGRSSDEMRMLGQLPCIDTRGIPADHYNRCVSLLQLQRLAVNLAC